MSLNPGALFARSCRIVASAAVLLTTGSLSTAPVLAAPAPPVVTFPAQQVTTGSTDIVIRGTAPTGASVVVFVDSDRDGRFHSALDYSWYRRVESNGTFEVPIFLQRQNSANPDLYAFTDTGSESSTLVKLPAIVHQAGAPAAVPQVTAPGLAPLPGSGPATAPMPAAAPAAGVPASPVTAAPPLLPAAPDLRPVPAPVEAPALSTTFQVGDEVEFRGFVGDDWKPGTVVEVRYGPVYLVQYMNEALAKPLETLVFPLNLRVPEGVDAPQVLLPGGELPLATYVCTYDTWTALPPNGRLESRQMGSFTLYADGTYSWLDDGEGGAYAYDPATGALTWLSGWFASGAPEETTVRRNSPQSAQVDIRWTGVYEWSCGANL